MGKFFTPTTTAATSYYIYFNNALYNPHSGHNSTGGGIISSTGFFISGDTTNEHFLDDNGEEFKTLLLQAGKRVYVDSTAGTDNYSTGEVFIESIFITTVSDVDGEASTQVRITVIPNSKDIVPVRNQILEIDFTNSTITGGVDTIAVSDSSAGATYTTSSSYTSTSSY